MTDATARHMRRHVSRPARRTTLAVVILCAGMMSVAAPETVRLAAAQNNVDASTSMPTLRLSMRDAMRASVKHNYAVKLVREQIAQAEGQAVIERGALLPNLSAQTSGAQQRFFFGTLSPTVGIYDSRLSMTQNIFSLSLLKKWRAARANVDVATLSAETQAQDTMSAAALAYLETLRFRKAVTARQADVTLNTELLRLAMERMTAGMATRLDVTRAKVRLKLETQRLLIARTDHRRSMLTLSRAIGLPLDVPLTLTDTLKLVDIAPQTVNDALRLAAANRVELKAQKTRARLAELTLSSVSMERLPSLAGSGNVGLTGSQIPDQGISHNLQILLSIPIFDGGRLQGRLSEQRSLVRVETITLRDIEQQIALEVRDALLTLESAQQQVDVAQAGLTLALEELELARQRFTVGVATNIEVTTAQTSVTQARDNLIDALFQFNISRVDVARSQGRLDDL